MGPRSSKVERSRNPGRIFRPEGVRHPRPGPFSGRRDPLWKPKIVTIVRLKNLALLALATSTTAACGEDFVEGVSPGTTSGTDTEVSSTQDPTGPGTTTTDDPSTSTVSPSTGADTEDPSTGPGVDTGDSSSSGSGSSTSSSTSTGDPVECGDGVAEGTEACDGDDLGELTCVGEGFFFGEPSCSERCEVDTSTCSNAVELCMAGGSGFDDGAPLVETLTIAQNAFVASVAVPVQITHADIGEVQVQLAVPDDLETRVLVSAACPGAADLDARFVDGGLAAGCGAPIAIEGDVRPAQPLAGLVGAPAMGDWSLTVEDGAAGNDGVLDTWCLQLELTADDPVACDDGVINFAESCDGDDLAGLECTDFDGFIAGALACSDTCTFDTSACVAPGCGNGIFEPGTEDCDSDELGGQTCADQGFASGVLACDDSCDFDTSACSTCGNDVIDGDDVCDGTALDGETCESQGFVGGAIGCAADCTGLDTSACSDTIVAVCSSPDLPITTATPIAVDTITVPDMGSIADVDFFVDVEHTWVSDLIVTVSDPTDEAVLFDADCTDGDDMFAVFDDEASGGTDCLEPVAVEGRITAEAPLSVFDGNDSATTFTLTVEDTFAAGQFGTLNEWCVYITLE